MGSFGTFASLFIDMYTKEEILKEFEDKGIEIPEPLMIEWDKLISKMKDIRNQNYLESLKTK